ncbi:MAG: hypothetical protein OXP37_02760 [Chloroflexota bacterium]|nr:hypothetical protein [Chloroflexota bacterium]MDE2935741.1 hypothetical protein [Chloroflexota bacterium]
MIGPIGVIQAVAVTGILQRLVADQAVVRQLGVAPSVTQLSFVAPVEGTGETVVGAAVGHPSHPGFDLSR